jgi:hypothetical protein
MLFSWVVALCSILAVCQHFGEHTASIFSSEDGDRDILGNILPPSSALKMETVCSPKSWHTAKILHGTTQKTTIYNMLQYHDNHFHRFSSCPVAVTRIKTVPSTFLLDISGILYASTPWPFRQTVLCLKICNFGHGHFLLQWKVIYKIFKLWWQ